MPSILQMFIYMIIVFIIYNILKRFAFSKFKVNKWIIFALAIISFLVPAFLQLNQTSYLSYITTAITVFLFGWFFDITLEQKKAKREKKSNIQIRPKAKPNRVKYKK